jgi:redox-sensitive bicupin YhaK (pirin superfamily)
MHGLQFWVALTDDQEDCDPSFQHYDNSMIPRHQNDIRELSMIVGEGYGLRSPVVASSPLVFAEVKARKDFDLELPWPKWDLAIYLIRGQAKVRKKEGTEELSAGQMLIFDGPPPSSINVKADTHLVVIGGDTCGGIWFQAPKKKLKMRNGAGATELFPWSPAKLNSSHYQSENLFINKKQFSELIA